MTRKKAQRNSLKDVLIGALFLLALASGILLLGWLVIHITVLAGEPPTLWYPDAILYVGLPPVSECFLVGICFIGIFLFFFSVLFVTWNILATLGGLALIITDYMGGRERNKSGFKC